MSKTIYEEEKEYLQEIQKNLEKTGLPCEFKENDQGMALFMPLAPTGPTSGIPLMVQLQKQPVANLDTEDNKEVEAVLSVLFVARLPIKGRPENILNTVMLLNYINTSYPLTGFELDMASMQPQFKYTLVNNLSHVDKTVLLSIVGIIMYAMDIFYAHIKDVAEGAISFQEALKRLAPAGTPEST